MLSSFYPLSIRLSGAEADGGAIVSYKFSRAMVYIFESIEHAFCSLFNRLASSINSSEEFQYKNLLPQAIISQHFFPPPKIFSIWVAYVQPLLKDTPTTPTLSCLLFPCLQQLQYRLGLHYHRYILPWLHTPQHITQHLPAAPPPTTGLQRLTAARHQGMMMMQEGADTTLVDKDPVSHFMLGILWRSHMGEADRSCRMTLRAGTPYNGVP